jgi:uncharacterized membrane protein
MPPFSITGAGPATAVPRAKRLIFKAADMITARLESFSDGVLAVAITLLSLNLAVSGPGHGPLTHQLGSRWPFFAAYSVSFFVIGIIWVNHHSLFKNLVRVDRGLLFLNLVLLLFVVLIPFATATMAEYLTVSGSDSHIAAALYGAVLEGMSLSFGAVFFWLVRHKNLRDPRSPEFSRTAVIRFELGSVFYLAAIGVAFVSAALTLVITAIAAVYYVFEQTPGGDESD